MYSVYSFQLFLDSEPEATNQPPAGLALDRAGKKRYTRRPDGERQAAVLEFFTVGGDRTAFLSGPVKGGGRRGRRGRELLFLC